MNKIKDENQTRIKLKLKSKSHPCADLFDEYLF